MAMAASTPSTTPTNTSSRRVKPACVLRSRRPECANCRHTSLCGSKAALMRGTKKANAPRNSLSAGRQARCAADHAMCIIYKPATSTRIRSANCVTKRVGRDNGKNVWLKELDVAALFLGGELAGLHEAFEMAHVV